MTRWTGAPAKVATLVLGDVLILAAALVLAYLLRFRWEVGALEHVAMAPFAEYAKLLILQLILAPLLFWLHDLYRIVRPRTGVDGLGAIVRAVTVGIVALLAATFFYRPQGFQYSRLTVVYWWGLSVLGVASLHTLFRRVQLARYNRGLDRQRVVLVGQPNSYLLERLRAPISGLEVRGYVDGGAREASDAPLPRLGGLAELPAILTRGGFDEVIVVERALPHRMLLEAIATCEGRGIPVRLVPPTDDLLVETADLTLIDGVPFIRVDEARERRVRMLVKRAADIVIAATLLVMLAPLLAALAIAVRLTSPGPTLFVQVRAGRNGRPFRMLKFRTMVADAERRLGRLIDADRLAEPVFKLRDDPRVTRLGRVLRRFSLDELPQLWNVLKGDMSLVGPRPEETWIVERYDVWQRRRLKIKPGLTGLQQVTRRGSTSLDERVRLDVYYLRHQSFLLDVTILLRTLWVVLTGRGAS